MVAVHFLPESQYPAGTGKFIYKPAIVDEMQLHLKQDRSRSHKSTIYPRTATPLQHNIMLLMTETKGSCTHMLLMTAWLIDESTSINSVICELKKSMPSDSRSQLQVTCKGI